MKMNVGSLGLNRTGNGGSSRDGNYNMARNHILAFLKSSFMNLIDEDNEDDLESWVQDQKDAGVNVMELICEIEIIEQFSNWLCDHDSKSNGEPLTQGTIGDILSGTKTVFNSLFPENTIFSGKGDQEWYSKMRQGSKNECSRRDFRRGVASSNKAKPVGRVLTKDVIEALIRRNTQTAYRSAVYIGTNYNAACRSGEIAYYVIDEDCYWDYDEQKLNISQNEMKVAGAKPNNFGCDAETYITDQHWLLQVVLNLYIIYLQVVLNLLDQTIVTVISYFQRYMIKRKVQRGLLPYSLVTS
jgi:hypothetical protein